MKESDKEESEINIISTSSKDEIINEKPEGLIPIQKDKSKEVSSIENISKKDTQDDAPKKPGRIGHKGTVELSKDCYLGADAAPSELLKDIVNINPETILSPLLTIRKSCFKRMTVENILKFQKINKVKYYHFETIL